MSVSGNVPMRIAKYRVMIERFIRYGIIGASGVGVNLGVLAVLHHLWPHQATVTYVLAVEASIITNYVLNAWFTFKASVHLHGFLRYNLVSAGGLVVQTAIYRVVLGQGINYIIADLIAIPFGTVIGFVLSNVWVFRTREALSSHDSIERPVTESASSAFRRSRGDR
ncbi:sugar translocase [Sulfobacillus sp. hq2]|nr:sugar translocase [Sulfobacillus sp. hq2]